MILFANENIRNGMPRTLLDELSVISWDRRTKADRFPSVIIKDTLDFLMNNSSSTVNNTVDNYTFSHVINETKLIKKFSLVSNFKFCYVFLIISFDSVKQLQALSSSLMELPWCSVVFQYSSKKWQSANTLEPEG